MAESSLIFFGECHFSYLPTNTAFQWISNNFYSSGAELIIYTHNKPDTVSTIIINRTSYFRGFLGWRTELPLPKITALWAFVTFSCLKDTWCRIGSIDITQNSPKTSSLMPNPLWHRCPLTLLPYLVSLCCHKAWFPYMCCRTHNGAWCLSIYGHQSHKQFQPSQQKPACSQQSCTCWSFARGCCGGDLWEPITQDTKNIFCPPEKKSKAKDKNIATTFGKSLSLTQYRMRYAIYIPSNTKDLAINLTIVAYGNQQNAITFARANNSDLLRALKYLMETSLNICIACCHDKVSPAPVSPVSPRVL